MIYVGDNRSDFEAIRRVGLTFVEAKQAALLRRVESLIGRMDGYAPPEAWIEALEQLPEIVEKISRRKADNRWSATARSP